MQVSRTEAYGVMGQAVRATRTALKLTATEFGKQVGSDHSNVCQWETGIAKPSLLRAMRIGAIAQGETRAWWIQHVLRELKASGADVAAFLSECVSADEQDAGAPGVQDAQLEELRGSIFGAASELGLYDGDDADSALSCLRLEIEGYSKMMWRLEGLLHSGSARADDVEAAVKERIARLERCQKAAAYLADRASCALTVIETRLYNEGSVCTTLHQALRQMKEVS